MTPQIHVEKRHQAAQEGDLADGVEDSSSTPGLLGVCHSGRIKSGADYARLDPRAKSDDPVEAIEINRALPPWALTALRSGVERKKPDSRKVWGKFVSIAMSCRKRGWTEVQYVEEMWAEETRIFPGGEKVFGYWPLTIQLLSSVKGSKIRAQRQIDRAWATAGDNLLRECTLKTTDDFTAQMLEWAWAWEERLDDHVDNLSVTQKRVMRYVTASVEKRRNSKVTCPCREGGAVVGIPHRTANYTLKLLASRGFLVLHDVQTAQTMKGELEDAKSKREPDDPMKWAGVEIVAELPSQLYYESVFGWASIECTGGERFLVGRIGRSHD